MQPSLVLNVLDPRNFPQYSETNWRKKLREELFEKRKWNSDLSGGYLREFEMHEGIFPRRVIPKSVGWHHLIYHEYNCFLLRPDEHRPQPPSRTLCYWLSVARYTKPLVDGWIDSLPWKVSPERPWRGTHGAEVIQELIETKHIFKARLEWLMSPAVVKEIDQEG